jgi:hypothetical protein
MLLNSKISYNAYTQRLVTVGDFFGDLGTLNRLKVLHGMSSNSNFCVDLIDLEALAERYHVFLALDLSPHLKDRRKISLCLQKRKEAQSKLSQL